MKQKKSESLGLPEQLLSQTLRNAPAGSGRTGFSGRGIYYFIAILLVLACALAFFTFFYKRQQQNKTIEFPKEVTTLQTSQVPAVFPTDLPFTKASAVLHNYQVAGVDNHVETVRKWKIDATPAEAAQAYREYFANNGWELLLEADQQPVQIIAARKEITTLSVSVRPEGSGALLEVVLK